MTQVTLRITRIGGDDQQLFIEGLDRKGDLKVLYALEASKQLRHFLNVGSTYAIDYKSSKDTQYVGIATGARKIS